MGLRNDASSQCGPHCDATLSHHTVASRSYGRTDVLTENSGFRDEKISRAVTRARAERDACGKHALSGLSPAERDTILAVGLLAENGIGIPQALTDGLLRIIERLEHTLAHASWGALLCDQQERFGSGFGSPETDAIRAIPSPDSGAAAESDSGPVMVYRFFDRCGCLLYVGITNDLDVRRAAHEKNSPWYKLAADFDHQEYPSRADAAEVELLAINAESPAFNRAGRSASATAEQMTAYLLAHAGSRTR